MEENGFSDELLTLDVRGLPATLTGAAPALCKVDYRNLLIHFVAMLIFYFVKPLVLLGYKHNVMMVPVSHLPYN